MSEFIHKLGQSIDVSLLLYLLNCEQLALLPHFVLNFLMNLNNIRYCEFRLILAKVNYEYLFMFIHRKDYIYPVCK